MLPGAARRQLDDGLLQRQPGGGGAAEEELREAAVEENGDRRLQGGPALLRFVEPAGVPGKGGPLVLQGSLPGARHGGVERLRAALGRVELAGQATAGEGEQCA